MYQIHSLQKLVLRLQLIAASAVLLLIGASLASFELINPRTYGGSRLLLFTPTPITVSLFVLGCILLLIYFWQYKNLKCPCCKRKLEKSTKSEEDVQESSTYLYLCKQCGVLWNTGISNSGWWYLYHHSSGLQWKQGNIYWTQVERKLLIKISLWADLTE